MSRPQYPSARREDTVEQIHGRRVADPYRWLEDPGGDETKNWLTAEDELFHREVDALPGRERLRGRVRELLGAGTIGAPVWRGERHFFMRRTAEQEHAVLYTVDPPAAPGEPGKERALIDPMELDSTHTTTLDSWQPDKEGRLLAYQLSHGGDEESKLYVMDMATGEIVEGPIDRCRYTVVAWLPGGEAYYYVRRLPADRVPAGEGQYHRRVYLHRVGTDPETDDVMIFGAGREKTNYYGVSVSRDGRWLTLSSSQGTAPRNDLWIADLSTSPADAPDLKAVQEGVDAETGVHVGRDGRAYIFTDRSAPRGRLCVADPADPSYEAWRDLLPEDREAVLSDFAILDDLDRPILLAGWTRHAISEMSMHDLETGERIGEVPLPGLGSTGGLHERPDGGHEVWFVYSGNTTPASVYRFDARAGETALWASPPGAVEVPDIDARQVTYTSYDGTEVRMLVIARPGGEGPRPAILYGYGGFNVPLTPAYSASILAWVEAGGVYAIANLRGGSEEGEDWHRAGMLDKKQNVFDDFHAAAEKLISGGWTTADRLSIAGGSNGGLLVGAAITQRPELFAAAVCSAPLLDMVRYEKSGLGQTWNVEYGSADDPRQFEWLYAYSPYHHVRNGEDYPATLFTVFESDTRVDPMHARKMCAALQHATSAAEVEPAGAEAAEVDAAGAEAAMAGTGHAQAGGKRSRPILLRNEAKVGHGSRAISRTVDLTVDVLSFAAAHTGLVIEDDV